MMSPENATVTEVNITTLAPAPLHALDIWSHPISVAQRFEAAMGFALPAMGRSAGINNLQLMRFEPSVWLVEGDVSALPTLLGEDGALIAMGGGIVRVQLSGTGWRALLMESGVFDAENPSFGPGCTAATLIDHVNVRLHVVRDDMCIAYVPASFSTGLIKFWTLASRNLFL
jgi:heterotetrameric sarcosine oxidase gamma subunit